MLSIYLEPTPYILALLREVRNIWTGNAECIFVSENLSQAWNISSDNGSDYLLLRSSFRLFVYLRRRFLVGDVAVLHLAGWGHPKLVLAMCLAWRYGVPVVMESDSQRPFEISTTKKLIKAAIYPLLFLIPAQFLPGGTRQSQYLRSYGVKDEKIHIAQMTVDVAAIMAFSNSFDTTKRAVWRERCDIKPEATVFLFVGRLEAHKGIANLTDAFERLVRTDHSTRLVIVGDGSMREVVERQAANCDWLLILGRLDGEDLLAAYCAADVLVLPSRFEPWGLVINEAMGAGLPVIVTNRVGCVDDLIDGRDTGLVYDYADSDGLFNALRTMSQDADSRFRMSRNARRLISTWTLREEAERIVAAWSRVA